MYRLCSPPEASIIPDLAILVVMPPWQPMVRAGMIKCLMPPYPRAGNHECLTLQTRIRKTPNQTFDIDWKTRAKNIAPRSSMDPCLTPAIMPNGMQRTTDTKPPAKASSSVVPSLPKMIWHKVGCTVLMYPNPL